MTEQQRPCRVSRRLLQISAQHCMNRSHAVVLYRISPVLPICLLILVFRCKNSVLATVHEGIPLLRISILVRLGNVESRGRDMLVTGEFPDSHCILLQMVEAEAYRFPGWVA